MSDHRGSRHPPGPFGMGRQGYAIIAIIVAATAVFAATRTDWVSTVLAAVVPPLILIPLVYVLSRRGREGDSVHRDRENTGQGLDLLTFLARTNPVMFLLFGAASRRQGDEQYRRLLEAGPYTLGRRGYLLLGLIILLPLICSLIAMVVFGHMPAHVGPHFP